MDLLIDNFFFFSNFTFFIQKYFKMLRFYIEIMIDTVIRETSSVIVWGNLIHQSEVWFCSLSNEEKKHFERNTHVCSEYHYQFFCCFILVLFDFYLSTHPAHCSFTWPTSFYRVIFYFVAHRNRYIHVISYAQYIPLTFRMLFYSRFTSFSFVIGYKQ